MKRIRNFIFKYSFKMVNILFCFLCLAIFLSTTLLDKNINNPYPNMATYSNGGYYFIAFVILGVVIYAGKFLERKIFNKQLIFISCIYIVVLVVVMTIISVWAPERYTGSDFRNIQSMAQELAVGGVFAENSYFQSSANNVHITILLSWIYGVTGSWRAIIWLGSMLVCLSVLLANWLVYQITENKFLTVVMLIISGTFMCFSWRTYITYTDNWGMIFPIAILCVYISKIRSGIKAGLIVFLTLIGAWIKITVLIPFIAILIYQFLYLINLRTISKEKLKGFFFIISICILLVLVGSVIEKCFTYRYDYQKTQDTKKFSYMLMAGQDESGLGTVGGHVYKEKWKEICLTYDTSTERMRACKDVALMWIRERGIVGNLKYYLKKLDVIYNDGAFHNVQPYEKSVVEKNVIYEIFSDDGKYYIRMAGFAQILWDFFLLLFFLTVFINIIGKKEKNIYTLFRITFLGITLYLLLCEGRAKYLFMFLPIYFAYAGIMLSEIKESTVRILDMYKFSDGEECENDKVN